MSGGMDWSRNAARRKRQTVECKMRRLAKMSEDPSDALHGTATGYNYGCRCDRCRAAKSIARLARLAARSVYVVDARHGSFAFGDKADAELFARMEGSAARECAVVECERMRR